MKVLNISRLANQIKNIKVIGINDKGHLILQGFGERVKCFGPVICASRIEFYEYNPENDELKADIFNDLIIPNLYINNNSNELGGDYFFEIENEEKVNIIKCNFNRNTYERLFSVCSVDDINNHTNIQLISLTDNYLAVKIYSKTTCQIFIYDKEKQKKYDILFPEDDDMRYAKIKNINIDNKPYIVFIKNGRSNLKFEYYIHKWEWNKNFKKYKDEKIFLFSLQELINKGNIFLDEQYKIAQADETKELYYRTNIKNCIVYLYDDLRKHDEQKETYEDELFFYDIVLRQIVRSIKYKGQILISNTGKIYERKKDIEQLILKDLDENIEYKPYRQNVWIEDIINDYMILKFKFVIIIYDLKKEKEIGRYYTEDKGSSDPQPEVREMFIYLNYKYKYFEKEDLLVLY